MAPRTGVWLPAEGPRQLMNKLKTLWACARGRRTVVHWAHHDCPRCKEQHGSHGPSARPVRLLVQRWPKACMNDTVHERATTHNMTNLRGPSKTIDGRRKNDTTNSDKAASNSPPKSNSRSHRLTGDMRSVDCAYRQMRLPPPSSDLCDDGLDLEVLH